MFYIKKKGKKDMKKRILGALFLSATLGLGLASCGGNDKVEVRFNLAYGNNLRTMTYNQIGRAHV